VQRGLLLDLDAAERTPFRVPRPLLRRQQGLRRGLCRDRYPGGQPVRVALHAPHRDGRRRGQRRIRRRRGQLERASGLGRRQVRPRRQVHRHEQAFPGRGRFSRGLQRIATRHEGDPLAGGPALQPLPGAGRVRRARGAVQRPRRRHDARAELLERRRHALDGRQGQRWRGRLRGGLGIHVRGLRAFLRLCLREPGPAGAGQGQRRAPAPGGGRRRAAERRRRGDAGRGPEHHALRPAPPCGDWRHQGARVAGPSPARPPRTAPAPRRAGPRVASRPGRRGRGRGVAAGPAAARRRRLRGAGAAAGALRAPGAGAVARRGRPGARAVSG
ncbi:unnamed protein product, partial [Prorocentrum cordatum]